MTGVDCGSPAAFRSSLWPVAITATFSSTVVVCCSLAPDGFPVSRMSTRVPGPTKPATETTSFTRTETARIPGGISDGKPDPAFSGASLLRRINKPLDMGITTPRPNAWDPLLYAIASVGPGSDYSHLQGRIYSAQQA